MFSERTSEETTRPIVQVKPQLPPTHRIIRVSLAGCRAIAHIHAWLQALHVHTFWRPWKRNQNCDGKAQASTGDPACSRAWRRLLTFHLWFILSQAPFLLPQFSMWRHHFLTSLCQPFLNSGPPTVSPRPTNSLWKDCPTLLPLTPRCWPLGLRCCTDVRSKSASVLISCGRRGCQWRGRVSEIPWASDTNADP